MFVFGITLVFIASTSLISGLSFQNIENGKICTTWQYVSGATPATDTSVCGSSINYELTTSNNMYMIRFCCSYNGITGPVVGPTPNGCGRQAFSPIRSRIVGGQEAAAHSWPWLVSLQYGGHHFCGGTLIDEYHVLTAAHCFQDSSMSVSDLTIVAGLHTRSSPHPQRAQHKKAIRIINHPAYNDNTNENDITVIRLSSPVTINNYVNFVCLPGRDPIVNQNVMIAGWGTTKYEGSSPDSLLQAGILVMDLCKHVYGSYDDNKQMCAGYYDYSKDSCQGDSGGPLMSEVNGQWILSGVVSYGDECAKLNRPGVYARVSHYLPWVRATISSLFG